jgi:CubicO group peptidase (beta-lactamase class C family)
VVDLDEAAGPPGSTFRHLLSHASGLPPEGETPIAKPGARRIYSNAGFEVMAERVAGAADMSFGDYLRGAVLAPLQMAASLDGSPASGISGTLDDLLALGRELLRPALIAPETLTRTTGDSASSSVTTSARTGPAAETRRPPSATSARAAASCGSIRRPGSRAPA